MHRGKRRQFSTGESNRAKAEDKARTILADFRSRGIEQTTKLHSRRVDRLPDDPTIEEFGDVYRKVEANADVPPSPQTQARYIKSIKLIGRELRISNIRSFPPEKIEQYKEHYLEESQKLKRDANSSRTSLNSILRNSAALFSKAALKGYSREGLCLENPFSGLKLKRVKIRSYSPLSPKFIEKLWSDSALLRDGNPDVNLSQVAKASTPKKGRQRWKQPDWRKPHKASYLILLLELGLGLRRHESDKAEWGWIIEVDGRHYLEVKETACFKPKSGESRVIPMDKSLFQALTKEKGGSPS
jgi:hypothetical protein